LSAGVGAARRRLYNEEVKSRASAAPALERACNDTRVTYHPAVTTIDTPLDQHGVERAYARLAHIYDLVFGLALHHGRARAMARMELTAGERVLEVGVGTGLGARLYPRHVRVVGIDLSAAMLRRARAHRGTLSLCRTDATALPFPDGAFDVVYAPYVMNAVPDARRVAQEMRRVARPGGGRLVFLNHFRSPRPAMQPVEQMVTRVTRHFGFTWDLELDWLLAQAALTPSLVEGVNIPRFSKLVICRVP
jgi:phosphatidylethanolamine/phosphatidyl-N-methylethanolamine N-methyltransferase